MAVDQHARGRSTRLSISAPAQYAQQRSASDRINRVGTRILSITVSQASRTGRSNALVLQSRCGSRCPLAYLYAQRAVNAVAQALAL